MGLLSLTLFFFFGFAVFFGSVCILDDEGADVDAGLVVDDDDEEEEEEEEEEEDEEEEDDDDDDEDGMEVDVRLRLYKAMPYSISCLV